MIIGLVHVVIVTVMFILNFVHCEITACDSDKQSLILSYLNLRSPSTSSATLVCASLKVSHRRCCHMQEQKSNLYWYSTSGNLPTSMRLIGFLAVDCFFSFNAQVATDSLLVKKHYNLPQRRNEKLSRVPRASYWVKCVSRSYSTWTIERQIA